jgi:peptidoglycan/LPS O-acetylase OafA/YrhL
LPLLPGLDGMRALAVMGVLLYHAGLAWIPGGFVGVEMFFVISGYLITSLLLAEWGQRGRIDFKAFWLRRARRLLPALFLLLLVLVAYALVFLPGEVAGLRGDVLSTAGYVNNWYQVFSHKSYFKAVGRPSLLRHMWSLAIEEQFYVIWPLLLSLVLGRLGRRRAVGLVLAGALASSLAMAGLFRPDADPSRVYYGTDTRAAGLLLGAALAFLWPPRTEPVALGQWVPDALGLTGLATVLACFVFLTEFQPFLYRGGFTLVDLATAELVVAAVHPRARLAPALLCWKPLRWIGLRSYGIYLWHFPVFMVTRPQLDVPLDGPVLLGMRLALTVVIAALSYRWLETPIRNGSLGRAWRAWHEAQGGQRAWWGLRWANGSVALVAVFSVLGAFLLAARPPALPDYLVRARPAEPKPASGLTNGPAAQGKMSGPALSNAPSMTTQALAQASAPPSPATNSRPPASAPVAPGGGLASPLVFAVTAVGDSVMEGVAEELRERLGPSTIVDADQGRLPWDTPDIVRDLRAAGKINPVVILHIGNNGFLSSGVFGQIMAQCQGARRVVVVNLKVPRRWESANNAMLASAVKGYTNAVLVDWHSFGVNRPELFWKDGIHVRPAGARLYANLVAQAARAPRPGAAVGGGP